MTCPRCRSEFVAPKTACPKCGISLSRSVSGVMKTSGVLIAAGGERSFYRSVQEVPEPLRTQLIETTNGVNSGTIVIADRAGKEQISQVLLRREEPQELPAVKSTPTSRRLTWLAWMALAFILTLGIVFSVLFNIKW